MLSILPKIPEIFGRNSKLKSPFQFLLTRTFGITSGGGPLIFGRNISTETHCSIFDKPVLCSNWGIR